MAKMKGTIEDEKEFANKEIESIEHKQGYFFDAVNHIHLLNGRPLIGTSSMASVLAKPLTWWAAGLAVEKLGWLYKGNKQVGFAPVADRLKKASEFKAKIPGMSDEEYLTLLDDAYKAHSIKLSSTAVAGTDMHEVMENYVKHCISKNGGAPDANYKLLAFGQKENQDKLQILIDWSILNVKRFLWSEVNCYSEKLWLGGISDCGFEDKDGKYGILDFKSSKDIYLPQFWQCIGYAIQLEENGGFTPEGVKVLTLEKPIDYVCVLPFGMKNPTVQYNYDVEGGKEAVKAMITLYKKLN